MPSVRGIDVEPDLAAWLAGRPAVVGLAGGRVWPWGKAPQGGAFPYLLYATVGGDRLRSTKGPTTRVSHQKLQLDAVGRTAEEAGSLAEAVALDIEDTLRTGALLGLRRVQSARCKLPVHGAGDPVFGDEAAEPRRTIELDIWFEEG